MSMSPRLILTLLGLATAGELAASGCSVERSLSDVVGEGGSGAATGAGASCGGDCAAARPCDADGDCSSGVCAFGVCQSPSCTDVVKNGAESDVDCGGTTCEPCPVGMACSGDDGDCTEAAYCAGHVCKAKIGMGRSCSTASQCVSDHCVDGVCCNTACEGACRACNLVAARGTCMLLPAEEDPADECPATTTCNGNGECGKVSGDACQEGTECATGFCVDGVCCGSQCAGKCMACSTAKNSKAADGTCGFIAPGYDPDGECPGASTCNGSDACSM